MLQFEPQTPGEVESEESKRARARGQSLADKSYAGREAQYFDGIKKLAAKFSRATVLVLKHTDALINLDMHQFLKSDQIKRLDPETKYRRLRQYFSERWGPNSSLDVAKIKADLTTMRGDDPGWRKYLQNFNYFVGSLESTQQRDANDMPSSVAQLPQPFILLGHHSQPQSRSTPYTSSPVSKPMKPETLSSRMAGQRSIISQPIPS